MPNYQNHEIPLNYLVPAEFQAPEYRGQLNVLLNKKAELNRLNGRDDKDIYSVDTLIDGDKVVVHGRKKDAEKFAGVVKNTNWK